MDIRLNLAISFFIDLPKAIGDMMNHNIAGDASEEGRIACDVVRWGDLFEVDCCYGFEGVGVDFGAAFGVLPEEFLDGVEVGIL